LTGSAPHQLLDRLEEDGGIDGLGQIARASGFPACALIDLECTPGDRYDLARSGARIGFYLPRHREPALVWKSEVHDDHRGLGSLRLVDRFLSRGRFFYAVAALLEQNRVRLADGGVVLDQEDDRPLLPTADHPPLRVSATSSDGMVK